MKARLGAVLGLASAAAALGIAHLVAAFVGSSSSPVVAVGGAAIDLTPEWLKSFAIRTFGAQDKLVLLVGIGAVVAVLAVVLGIASLRRPHVGLVGLALLGAVGALAALTRPTAAAHRRPPCPRGRGDRRAHPRDAAPPAHRRGTATEVPESEAHPLDRVDRRRFLVASGVAFGAAAAAGVLGGFLSRRKQADASRAAITVPAAADAAPAASTGADLGVDGLSPFYTPNGDFYRVDTALIVPSVPAEDWRLRVHGMVERELTLDYEQLTSRPLIERDVTLACVSNEVGGPYVGNARWIGAPLGDLLAEAGVDRAATQLVSTSSDGFTAGTPVDAVIDGRDAMLAVAMNGEPLPIEHGFPVRMVVPGLYGYVSATKWLVDLELTTFEAFDPYWIRRGWAEQAPIKTQSRIDIPAPLAQVSGGRRRRGRGRVGPAPRHRPRRGSDRRWRLAGSRALDRGHDRHVAPVADHAPLTAGNRTITVRATDGEGDVQTEARAEPFPDGATGQHSIVIQVG